VCFGVGSGCRSASYRFEKTDYGRVKLWSRFTRSAAERVNGALKDSYGGRFVRVRGHDKVLCHLMFGVLAPTVEQLMRFVT